MSALDARIRRLAREEIGSGADSADGPGRVSELEQAVTCLHGTVLRLEARIDELEKGAAPTPKRATRKTTEPSE